MDTVVIAQDRQGTNIAELDGVSVPQRTWMLKETGDAELRIPRTHWKSVRHYIEAYNRILIQSDTGAGGWTGVVARRSWQGTELVMGLEDLRFLFDRRRLSWGLLNSGMTAGEVIATIVGDANVQYGLGLRITEPFEYTGLVHDPQEGWHWRDALECLDEITDWEGSYWWVDEHSDVHHAHRRGQDKPWVALLEGMHIVGTPTFSEDFTTIINDTIVASSQDEDWLVTCPYQDPDSIDNWGRFADMVLVDWETDEGVGFLPVAQSHVKELKDPYSTIDMTICNKGNVYEHLREGNVVTVEIPSYGFAGLKVEAMILGRTVTEPNDQMRIILEVTKVAST